MITETGIVTQATENVAWVKTTRSAACAGCTAQKSCGTAGMMGDDHIVEVRNTIGVQTGDTVIIGLETGPMLLLTFLVYIVPILCLVSGALAGDALAPVLNFNPSAAAMITGFSCLGLSFFIIRLNSSRLKRKKGYTPFLVRKSLPSDIPVCRPLPQ